MKMNGGGGGRQILNFEFELIVIVLLKNYQLSKFCSKFLLKCAVIAAKGIPGDNKVVSQFVCFHSHAMSHVAILFLVMLQRPVCTVSFPF